MRCSDGLQYLILRFPGWTLSGLVGNADSPPIKFTFFLGVWHLPISVFFILQVASSNALAFQKNLEVSASFLMITLQLCIYDVLGGGFKVARKLDERFREIWIVCPVQYSWQSLILLPGFYINPPLYGGGLVGLSYPSYLFKRVSGVLGGTASRIRAMYREVFFLTYIFVVLWQRMCQLDVLPSIRRYLLCSSVSYYHVEEKRIK